ncbi:MAG: hypothetical protein QG656_966 [Candidatus Hydrogenedentes bacterium]|nr:hypothetical protein [Candidatus Hydrogenedentota bacterium]
MAGLMGSAGSVVTGLGLTAFAGGDAGGFGTVIAVECLLTSLAFGLVASAGIVAARYMAGPWRYGWFVAAAAGMAYALNLLEVAASWEAWQATVQAVSDAWTGMLAERANENAGVARQLEWLRQHWYDVLFGAMFWPTLVGACLGLSLAAKRLRACGQTALSNSFATMRTPEWLVWIAIVLAGVWFANRAWPHDLVRMATLNLAVGLAAVYFVNGVSILFYFYTVLRPNPLLTASFVILLLLSAAQPLICSIGFFDTWADFRRTVDKIAEARKRARDAHDDLDE